MWAPQSRVSLWVLEGMQGPRPHTAPVELKKLLM